MACSADLGALGSSAVVKPENISKIVDNNSRDWMIKSKCRGVAPSAFFPSDGAGVELAKTICRDCVVKTECLDYAILNKQEHGVWGGESERERKRIAKQRRNS